MHPKNSLLAVNHAYLLVAALVVACGGSTEANNNPSGSAGSSNSGGTGGSSGGSGGSNSGGSAGNSTGGSSANAGTAGSAGSAAVAGSAGSSGSVAGEGLPCDIQQTLEKYCQSCHSSPPSQNALMPLMTLADLKAPAISDSTKTNGEVSVARMQNANAPMPPAPATPVSAAEFAAFQSWVQSGMPAGDCGTGGAGGAAGGGGAGGDPYNTPTVCTSNQYWTQGDHGSDLMHPGLACLDCHKLGGEATTKTFDIAGTVYPTAHEPDDCNGFSGASVVIVDANGQEHPLTVNSAGNFYHEDFFGLQKLAFPYTAKVVYQGQERIMATEQNTGDCNSCHTVDGASNAPGRIMLP